MTNDFKRKCLADIRPSILPPQKNSVIINADNLRFCYRVRGQKNYRYIYFPSLQQAAQFLLEQGKIYFYADNPSGVRLYEKHLETTDTTGIIQTVVMKELLWSQLQFTADEIIHYAAINEFMAAGAIIGLVKAKVINIAWSVINHAA